MSTIAITFSTYPTLQRNFKEHCRILSVGMGEKLESIIQQYLDGKSGSIEELNNALYQFKQNAPKETKSYKLTLRVEATVYEKLKQKLDPQNIRPATFLTALIASELVQVPSIDFYKRKAEELAEKIKHSNIAYIVYAIDYYKPAEDTMELVHTEYLMDCCTNERFEKIYGGYINTSIFNVLFVWVKKGGEH